MSHILLDLQHIIVISLLFPLIHENKLGMYFLSFFLCIFHTCFPVEICFWSC